MNSYIVVLEMAAATAIVGSWMFVQRKRSADMRNLARRLGLSYTGTDIPRSLTLTGTQIEKTSQVWNLIEGTPHGVNVIAFDCRIGRGKWSRCRTIIAARESNPFPATVFDKDLTVERMGDWSLLYRSNAPSFFGFQLMPLAELEAHLDSIENQDGR